MNFEFSADQQRLREEACRLLAAECGTAATRAALDGDDAPAERLWRRMAELGWTGVALPEDYGGAGYGALELCVLAEEMGRVLAPTAFASSVYLAADLILHAGDEGQKRRYLPALAKGERIGTVAVAEGPGETRPENLRCRAAGGAVSGVKIAAPDGAAADLAIVLAADGDGACGLYLVDLNGLGVLRRPQRSLDPGRPVAELAFDAAPAERLGPAGAGWDLLSDLYDRAAVLFAFEQVGGAEAALAEACDYARDRHAFGRPIGSFQAVKHKLADIYAANVLAKSNCYHAAWAFAEGAPDLRASAATARLSAGHAFDLAASENIQIHGGMGVTWDFDCHLFYRRARALAVNLGGRRVWEDRLIEALQNQRRPAA